MVDQLAATASAMGSAGVTGDNGSAAKADALHSWSSSARTSAAVSRILSWGTVSRSSLCSLSPTRFLPAASRVRRADCSRPVRTGAALNAGSRPGLTEEHDVEPLEFAAATRSHAANAALANRREEVRGALRM